MIPNQPRLKSSYVNLTPDQRSALKALYSRTSAEGELPTGADLPHRVKAELQALIDKGLVQADRLALTPRGHALAEVINSEKQPYERAYYLTAYEI
jgi:hypothetical protein